MHYLLSCIIVLAILIYYCGAYILEFNLSLLLSRYGSDVRHRVVEDKLMRQKARLLHEEAATWSLLWYLYGKGNN